MGVLQQKLSGQGLDVLRVLDLAAQRFQGGVQVQCGDRVGVVGRVAQRGQYQLQAKGIAVPADLPLVQFELVQHRFQLVHGDPFRGNPLENLKHLCLEGIPVLRLAALDAAGENHLPHRILQSTQRRGGMTQIGGFQRLLQGRRAVVQEHVGEQLGLQHLLEIRALSQQPCDDDMGLSVGAGTVVIGVAVLDTQGLVKALLQWHFDAFVEFPEAAERLLLEGGLVPVRRHIAKGHEYRVAGMVVGAIELLELLVAQIRNVFRLAAAVEVVGIAGKQVVAEGLPQGAGHRAHCAFHFIEDHTLEQQLAVRVTRFREFQPVTFLGEIQRVQPGEEHGVQVDIQQVVEVLRVLTRKRVCSPVAAGERVHEGVERAPQHQEKRVPHRVSFAAAQGGVLQNVGNTGGIFGYCTQGHQEYVLAVVRGQVVVRSAGFPVHELLDVKVE